LIGRASYTALSSLRLKMSSMFSVEFADLASHSEATSTIIQDSIHEFGCVIVRNVPAIAEAREIAFQSAVALNALSRPEFLAALASLGLKTDNKSDDIISIVSYINPKRDAAAESCKGTDPLPSALNTLTSAMTDVAVLVLESLGVLDVAAVVRKGQNHKGRLIVYRPKVTGDWLGSHCDYGVITALLKPLLLSPE
jgi:hypothetical protein